jgi:hypothetical protein
LLDQDILTILLNKDKTQGLRVNKELLLSVLSSRDDFESLYKGLCIQLEQLSDLEIIEIVIHDEKQFQKACNLIQKRIN